MRVTQNDDNSITLDGSGELTFTRNDPAFSSDEPLALEVRFQFLTYIGYYGGLWSRLQRCWMLWKWLGNTDDHN